MNFIDPLEMTDAQFLAGTSLAEDPTPAWLTGTNYAIGDEVHLVATHRVYRTATAGVSTVSPDLDTTRWNNERPTNKWAPFDIYTNTQAESTAADIVYSLASRYVNALYLGGLAGRGVVVSVKAVHGGAEVWRFPVTGEATLKAPATGYWNYAYGKRRRRDSLVVLGIPIYPNAQIDITITGGSGQRRAVGMISRGTLQSLQGLMGIGGAQAGAEAIPKTFTYRKTGDDGRVTIVPRGSAKDLQVTVFMAKEQADNAVAMLTGLLSTPVAWFATDSPGFDGLRAFGIASRAPVKYMENHATCNINIEGFV